MRHHPAQPAEHLGHVRAEDAPVAVALVNDHETQSAEETGPACVPRQQRAVQHVRRGEQVPGVGAGPVPFGSGRVAVQGGGLHAGQAQGPDRGELVGREGLGGRDIEHSVACQHRRQGRQQVSERLARRGGGRDDHVAAGLGVRCGDGLVGPGGADAPGGERADDLGRNPRWPGTFATRAGRDVLHVDGPAGPRAAQQDAQRTILRSGRHGNGSGGHSKVRGRRGGRSPGGKFCRVRQLFNRRNGRGDRHKDFSLSSVGGCSEA